jgi:ribonuclease ZC3H12
MAVDYFKERGHTEIKAFVPQFRSINLNGETPTKNPEILQNLYKSGYLVYTPSKSYDDGFILETARIKDAIIVSNDNYNDLIFAEKYASQKANR